MHNVSNPGPAVLPSPRQLLRSTIIAVATVLVLLVTAVLPAEYGIDPTGIGNVLGLTEMGEIKMQLQEEAEADRARDQGRAPAPERRSGMDRVGTFLAGFLVAPAAAQTPPAAPLTDRTETFTLTLQPTEGVEVKMVMEEGATVTYSWKAEGGVVNHDTHGEAFDNPDAVHSYKKDRAVGGDEGTLNAVFAGKHGWFWRNRGRTPVTITLTVSGAFSELKRVT